LLLPPSCLSADRRPVAHCTAADALLDQMPAAVILNGDKRYDSDVLRRKIESKGGRSEHSTEGKPTLEELLLAYLYRDRTPSSACSEASRIFAESQLDATATLTTFSPPSVSSLPFAIGRESGP